MIVENDKRKIHVKCSLSGEPARIVRELKKRIGSSNGEAIIDALLALYGRVIASSRLLQNKDDIGFHAFFNLIEKQQILEVH